MTAQVPSDQFVSLKLTTLAAARRKCEEAADVVIAGTFGYWIWITERQLGVFNEKNERVATVHVESVQ